MTDGLIQIALFAKVQKADYRGAQNLERELHFLSNVAPLIAAENPALRSPVPIAYYPEQRLLLMEFVPGESLKHHLFNIKFDLNPVGTGNLAELLQSAGRWLGSFHRLTLQSTRGNPLEWLLHEFDSKRTKEAFLFYSQKNIHDEMLSILKKCLDLNPKFQRNLCNVHGEFTPIHVMVASDAIYVIDFGNSRLAYPYEDIGLFTGFYDGLPLWRVAAGSMRIRLPIQKELFLSGYFEQCPAAFHTSDWAIMRWVRLISFARLLNAGQPRSSGWGKWMYSRLTQQTLRKRFRTICDIELAAMRDIHPDIFNENSLAPRNSGCAAWNSPDIDRLASD
jgi:aminoglycoside phosphotransferase (APT) family kinase protein